MALTQREKEALTEFSKTQTALQPRGSTPGIDPRVDLGTVLDDMQVETTADITQLQADDETTQADVDELQLDVQGLQTAPISKAFPFTLPAPAAGAVTKDFIAFKAPADGNLLGVEVIPSGTWTAGNNVGDKYLVSVHRYNNTPGDVSFAHDVVTGMGAGESETIPTGSSNALLTATKTLALDATGTSVLFTNEVAWVTTPVIGDYVSLTSAAAAYVGATIANPGVYVITAVTALTMTATKLFGAAPEDVVAAVAGAGEVAALRLIRNQEASFSEGDVLGLRIIVPINTTTPVDVSTLSFMAAFRYELI